MYKVIHIVTLLAIFSICCFVGPNMDTSLVYGHANPVTYQPAPNQVIELSQSVPDVATITFTERPELLASSLKVVNSNNERVDNNDLGLGETDKTLTVSLNTDMINEGVYTVSWLVLSKDDGHITKGSYVFSVNESGPNQQQQQQQQSSINQSSGYLSNITTSDNVDIQFSITPSQVGQNSFLANYTLDNGTAVQNIKDVYLEFNNPSKRLGPIIDKMEKMDDGNYSLSGNYLSQNGDWEIKMTVQRIGEYDINQTYDLTIN